MDENTTTPESQKKNNNTMVYAGIAVIILLLVGGGLYLGRKAMKASQQTASTQTPAMKQVAGAMSDQTAMTKSASPSSVTPSTSASPSAANISDATAQQITVTGSNFAFDPKTITAKKGQKITVVFKNSGGMHDFKIDEFNVATKKIQTGETDTVTFTADKTGTFQYYCSVGSHRAMGMKGTLTVE